MMLTFVKVWNDYATTVDANGFIKKASPIARLSGAPEKMFDDYLTDLHCQAVQLLTVRR